MVSHRRFSKPLPSTTRPPLQVFRTTAFCGRSGRRLPRRGGSRCPRCYPARGSSSSRRRAPHDECRSFREGSRPGPTPAATRSSQEIACTVDVVENDGSARARSAAARRRRRPRAPTTHWPARVIAQDGQSCSRSSPPAFTDLPLSCRSSLRSSPGSVSASSEARSSHRPSSPACPGPPPATRSSWTPSPGSLLPSRGKARAPAWLKIQRLAAYLPSVSGVDPAPAPEYVAFLPTSLPRLENSCFDTSVLPTVVALDTHFASLSRTRRGDQSAWKTE